MPHTERITIRYVDGFEPSAVEIGLEGFYVSGECHSFVYGGRKPGPGEVYGTITVALIAAGAGVVGAAITGVCAYLASRGAQKVSIRSANGRAIEFPVDTSKEQVEAMVKLAIAMDNPEILIGSPRAVSEYADRAKESAAATWREHGLGGGDDSERDSPGKDVWFP